MCKDVVMLIAPTTRSKAYLQCMIKNDIFPAKVLIMTEESQSLLKEKMKEAGISEYFDIHEPIMKTINMSGIEYEFLNTKDVNSECVKEALQRCEQKYIIYSGYGGAILKKHLFELGKRFIHVHAGALPEYRGSTTAYYSMIDKGYISATAIFMNENLDDGDVISTADFEMPESEVDIDYIYEPYTRAQVLVNALQEYRKCGEFSTKEQQKENAETYYIIHPVLKHIARLGVESQDDQERIKKWKQ